MNINDLYTEDREKLKSEEKRLINEMINRRMSPSDAVRVYARQVDNICSRYYYKGKQFGYSRFSRENK